MKKILVIEDQAAIRTLFLRSLKDQGFYTIGAENGRIGIEQAQTQLPDLIICDIMMPEVDGYKVLTELRQDNTTAVIPFIFVSSKEERIDIRKGMELGANDYLTKPCTIEELSRAIATQLQKQTILQQCYQEQSQLILKPLTVDTVTLEAGSDSIFPASSDSKLNRVFQFIEANYHQAIALKDVAQAVGYSPAYLTNLMRRKTGQTVQHWIIARRMAAARLLLLHTDQTAEKIATQIGYHYAVHFFRQFRQVHATTPQAWRSIHRN